MATHLAEGFNEKRKKIKHNFKQAMYGDHNGGGVTSTTFIRPSVESYHEGSSNDLMTDDSQYNVETVLSSSATEDTGVQNSRVVLVQRSTLAPTMSLDSSAMVYLMALLLPLVSVSNFNLPSSWLCAQSAALRASELLVIQVKRLYEQIRAQVRRLARNEMTREYFATAMDIVLVVYGIGFLFLSLYQASIIG